MMISVIIPSYNRAHIIQRAIDSVLSQTYECFEIIIVDDGSDDNTKSIVSSIKDNRIRYIYQENKGVCTARNKGIFQAKGDYLTFLDSDDYANQNWLSDFNEKILDNSFDLIFCDIKIFYLHDKTEKIVRALYPYLDNKYDEVGLYLAGAFCVKNAFIKKIGGFDEKIKFGEFTELGLKCMKLYPLKSFTEKLGLVYEVTENGGGKNLLNKIESNLYLIEKHDWFFKEQPNTLRLYYQNIGLAYYKLNIHKESRDYFWKAYSINTFKIKNLIRIVISYYSELTQKKVKRI